MAFADFPEQEDVVQLLQRSLAGGRLGHAYLFVGADLAELEVVARTLAKTVNCENPPQSGCDGRPVECCDRCLSCRKIDEGNHPDVLAVRPESKLRVITIEQIRELLQTIYLKPVQARFKVALITGADRLNVHAANAFLKTLEEPPANSILALLSTAPERILETIVSRCLRLNFAGTSGHQDGGPFQDWLARFGETARGGQRSLLGRYRLLAVLIGQLNAIRDEITATLTQRSPLERYEDLDPKLRDKYEDELAAAIESEYRHRRSDLLTAVQWWLRDIWLETLHLSEDMRVYPKLAQAAREIGARLTAEEAAANLGVMEELQRILQTNVQEALVMEVSLLRLKL